MRVVVEWRGVATGPPTRGAVVLRAQRRAGEQRRGDEDRRHDGRGSTLFGEDELLRCASAGKHCYAERERVRRTFADPSDEDKGRMCLHRFIPSVLVASERDCVQDAQLNRYCSCAALIPMPLSLSYQAASSQFRLKIKSLAPEHRKRVSWRVRQEIISGTAESIHFPPHVASPFPSLCCWASIYPSLPQTLLRRCRWHVR